MPLDCGIDIEPGRSLAKSARLISHRPMELDRQNITIFEPVAEWAAAYHKFFTERYGAQASG